MSRLKDRRTILIVEDDVGQLNRYLEMGNEALLDVKGVANLKDATQLLGTNAFQFVLTDIHLGGTGRQDTFEGLEILKQVRQNHPESVPLAMSSDPQVETYHRAMKAGSVYFFRKPILGPGELLVHLDAAQSGRRTRTQASRRGSLQALPPDLLRRVPDGVVLPQSIRDRVRRALSNHTLPIVISGETGTGKEEVAKMLHRMRSTIDGPVPFVAVNCANLSGDMAVSALFGHKRGAFTGATETTAGFIGDADGGYLFLDEIQALTKDCQQRLLRVLNDGSYNRVGDTQTLHSDFQTVVASTKDLDDEVDKGNFLLDLRSRLTGFTVTLPPLRERLDELPLLIEIALARQGASVSPVTLAELTKRCSGYYWQGNVRQLMQVISVLATEALCDGKEIRADELPEFKTMFAPGASEAPAATRAPTPATHGDQDIVEAELALRKAVAGDVSFEVTMEAIEKAVFSQAMKRHGSLRAASEALQISRSMLGSKWNKYKDPE